LTKKRFKPYDPAKFHVQWETAMLGLGDGWVFLSYLLCILSAILCIVYGIVKWNSGGENP
jgi:hypothetical protein